MIHLCFFIAVSIESGLIAWDMTSGGYLSKALA